VFGDRELITDVSAHFKKDAKNSDEVYQKLKLEKSEKSEKNRSEQSFSPSGAPAPPTAKEKDVTDAMQKGSRTSTDSTLRGKKGLANLGNTCFMSVVLQCWSHIATLMNLFLSEEYVQHINKENADGTRGKLANAFSELMKKLWARDGTVSVEPGAFKSALAKFAPQFRGYNQQDAQELLEFLLDGLHEDLNSVKEKQYVEEIDAAGKSDADVAKAQKENHLARNKSPIDDMFLGFVKTTTTCPNCKRASVKFDPYKFLSVPFPPSSEMKARIDLSACLKQFIKKEQLEWYCDGECKKNVLEAQSFTKIWSAPPILIVHLKRVYSDGKIITPVDYPLEDFDISPFVDENSKADDDWKAPTTSYDLCGVVCHSGESVHGGHYIAYTKHAESGEWHCYNDVECEQIGAEEVRDPDPDSKEKTIFLAYILIYKRKDVKDVLDEKLPTSVTRQPQQPTTPSIATPPVSRSVTEEPKIEMKTEKTKETVKKTKKTKPTLKKPPPKKAGEGEEPRWFTPWNKGYNAFSIFDSPEVPTDEKGRFKYPGEELEQKTRKMREDLSKIKREPLKKMLKNNYITPVKNENNKSALIEMGVDGKLHGGLQQQCPKCGNNSSQSIRYVWKDPFDAKCGQVYCRGKYDEKKKVFYRCVFHQPLSEYERPMWRDTEEEDAKETKGVRGKRHKVEGSKSEEEKNAEEEVQKIGAKLKDIEKKSDNQTSFAKNLRSLIKSEGLNCLNDPYIAGIEIGKWLEQSKRKPLAKQIEYIVQKMFVKWPPKREEESQFNVNIIRALKLLVERAHKHNDSKKKEKQNDLIIDSKSIAPFSRAFTILSKLKHDVDLKAKGSVKNIEGLSPIVVEAINNYYYEDGSFGRYFENELTLKTKKKKESKEPKEPKEPQPTTKKQTTPKPKKQAAATTKKKRAAATTKKKQAAATTKKQTTPKPKKKQAAATTKKRKEKPTKSPTKVSPAEKKAKVSKNQRNANED